MRRQHCTLWANFEMITPSDRVAWMHSILRSMPVGQGPKYFSRTELLRRHAAFEVANTVALEEYLASERSYYLFGDGYELSVSSDHCIELYGASLAKSVSLLSEWVPTLSSHGVVYGNAGTPDEYEHRNGYTVRFSNTASGYAHGWVGRDHTRYVPGLYWLNYFSRDYAAQHGLQIDSLRTQTDGVLTELPPGWTLLLYDSPAQWPEWSERIDDLLYTTPGFFSKRRVNLPEAVHTLECDRVIDEATANWP